MITKEEIVTEARRWLETPYQHQARLLGVGVDCAGLIMGVGENTGVLHVDYRGYGQLPHKGMLRKICDSHLVPIEEVEAGAVLLMGFSDDPAQEQHLAIYTGHGTIIHSYESVGTCTEHRYSDVWRSRTRQIYRFPGVV
jgi:NlpC/P60 family putative phage cell wall peptidase